MKKTDPDFFSQIGLIGGQANIDKNGLEHMAEIGTRGGNALLAKRGKEYYAEIGRKGQLERKRKKLLANAVTH